MTNNTDIQIYAASIDLVGVERCWPDHQPFPQLLRDVAAFLVDKPQASVGYVRMEATRFDDYYIEGGADLWPQFGMFMTLPSGTRFAVWFHDGAVAGGEPIVVLGQEGELLVMAPNLKSFLADWAAGRIANDFLASDIGRPDPATSDEKHWSDAVAAELTRLVAKAPEPPLGSPADNIDNFIQDYGAATRARDAANPIHQEIARLMEAHIPRGKEIYEYYHCGIVIAGDRIEFAPPGMAPEYKMREPLPERDALIPLILKARQARAGGAHAVRGLWNNASLRISPDGHVTLHADWEFEPKFEHGGRVTAADLRADLARFPRSDRWTPEWMADILEGQ